MNPINSALGDPLGLSIDVADLGEHWSSKGGIRKCAACGRFLLEGESPLVLLWRRKGTEMLALHWDCARARMISVGQRN